MIRISLTDFVDIVHASGVPRMNKVRKVKERDPYHPAFDFYKQFREGLQEHHQQGLTKKQLVSSIGPVSDPRKAPHYADLTKGYKKWWGHKSLIWFPPPSGRYSSNGVDIRVNPELGLKSNGTSYVIKLYMKSDSISNARIKLITHMMATTCTTNVPTTMAVMDVRRGRLVTPKKPTANISAAVKAELAYVASLWASL